MQNPYVGPRAFEQEESDYFFGRDEEIRILMGLVMARQVVLFFAKSGVGKSSLVRAGLIPKLTEHKIVGQGRRARRIEPKMHVLPPVSVGGGIRSQASQSIANVFIYSALLNLRPDLSGDALSSLDLITGLQPLLEAAPTDSAGQTLPSLLVFDQFEELFTRHQEHWRQRSDFFRQVNQALATYENLRVLFVMREDYIAELVPHADLLPDRLRSRFRMEQLGHEAAIEAIEQPALKEGRHFAPGVAASLVNNLSRIQSGQQHQPQPTLTPDDEAETPLSVSFVEGASVEPVHLQIVCRDLWSKLPSEQTTIEPDDVAEFGDVDQALIGFYETALQKVLEQIRYPSTYPPTEPVLSEVEKGTEGEQTAESSPTPNLSERALRDWFGKELITPARTKGLVYQGKTETEGLPNPVVDILSDAYIIRADKRGSNTWYEIAHDRLVEPILASNQRWLTTYYNPLLTATRAWLESGRAPNKLLEGSQLQEAQTFAETNRSDLTEQEREFLVESERKARRRRIYVVAAISVIIALSLLTVWALIQKNEAERQARRALAGQLAAQSQTEGKPQLSLLLALEAINTTTAQNEPLLPRAEQALRDVLRKPGGIPLTGHQAEILDLAISPEGRWLATVSADTTARLWDLKADIPASTFLELKGHGDQVNTAAFSPDGRWLATGGEDAVAILWDLLEPEPTIDPVYLEGHDLGLNAVAFSPNGHWLATASDDTTAVLWDLEASDPNAEPIFLLGHEAPIVAIGFSQDGRWLATASEDTLVMLWDMALSDPGAEPLSLVGHDDEITAIAFDPAERWLVTVSRDETARLWDLQTSDPSIDPLVLTEHDDELLIPTFSPDGHWLVTAGQDEMPRLWDMQADDPTINSVVLRGHTDAIGAAVFSPGGRWLATASQDGDLQLWDFEADNFANNPLVLGGHDAWVSGLAFSPDESWLVSASFDMTARLWPLQRYGPPGEPFILRGHDEFINAVALSPDERWLVTASDDTTALLWDLAADDPNVTPRTLARHDDFVMDVAFSSSGRWLATVSQDATAKLWDLQSAESTEPVMAFNHPDQLYAVDFSPDERWLATAGQDATVWLWDLQADDPTAQPKMLPDHKDIIYDVAFSTDGRWLATASTDGTARLWDLQDSFSEAGEARVLDHSVGVNAVAFSPDGRWLATSTAEDNMVEIWDLQVDNADTSDRVLSGHQAEVRRLTFSPDGRWLATASGDSTARLWDLQADDPEANPIILRSHSSDVTDVAFTTSGQRLVTVSADATARVWNMQLAELIDQACRIAGRNMTDEEWATYLPQYDYHQTCPDAP